MIRIPEGFVFIPKAPGVAAELLDIADEVRADRKLGVRTASGGYNVADVIASEYLARHADVVPTVQAIVVSPEEAEELSAVQTALIPDMSWTVAEIEDWAAQQDPPIVFPDRAKKPEKIAIIGESIK